CARHNRRLAADARQLAPSLFPKEPGPGVSSLAPALPVAPEDATGAEGPQCTRPLCAGENTDAIARLSTGLAAVSLREGVHRGTPPRQQQVSVGERRRTRVAENVARSSRGSRRSRWRATTARAVRPGKC